MNVVTKYREAAMSLWGLSKSEARAAIYSPEDDRGEWAPESMAVISLETGHLPISYWNPNFLDQCIRLGDAAGVGYVECINAAICAVYEL